jgi:2-polyprenyl-6-hydroxyphenyl methylase/3-demethylubiquinone-9 3-methyltransferase
MSHIEGGRTNGGRRFEFGANWRRFLAVLDESRIEDAQRSLREFLGIDDLRGMSFLDIGSGSGLFSLAARRLGARVFSFDYDPESVECTAELRRRYFPDDKNWKVTQGSVLDAGFLRSLGEFDIVYSWGVLHHTGRMWEALENATIPVKPGGSLYIAIYNFQRPWTALWGFIKRLYNRSPRLLRPSLVLGVMAVLETRSLLFWLVQLRPTQFFHRRREYQNKSRGMNRWRDVVDWVGGYPFEAAKPEEIFGFYRKKGFVLRALQTCGAGHGCNQFVFSACTAKPGASAA